MSSSFTPCVDVVCGSIDCSGCNCAIDAPVDVPIDLSGTVATVATVATDATDATDATVATDVPIVPADLPVSAADIDSDASIDIDDVVSYDSNMD